MRLLALFCLVPASLAPSALAAQPITPKFAWPVGASAEVSITTSNSVSAEAGGASDSRSAGVTVKTRIAVEAHAEGLRIVNGPGSVEGSTGMAQGVGDPSQLLAMRSAFIVARDGRFLRLDDTTALRKTVDSAMAPLLAQIRGSAPQMVPMMEQSLGIESLREMSAQQWSAQVEAFTARTWNVGDSSASTIQQRVPIGPGATIAVPRVIRYEGTTPCPAGRSGTCWRFVVRTVVTRKAMRGVMANMLKQMGAGDPAMLDQIPIPEVSTSSVLVFDAATLLPLSSEASTKTDGAGAMMQMSGTGSITSTYRWK